MTTTTLHAISSAEQADPAASVVTPRAA